MRAILSGLHPKQGKQELEFELIDVPGPYDDLAVTFFEKESRASLTVPVENVTNGNIMHVLLDANDFAFADFDQSQFSWELYLNLISHETRGVIQVESEYLSDRHQLSLTSWYQFSSDANGRALFDLHVEQPQNEFSVNSINLFPDRLQITGHNQINSRPIESQSIVLKNRANESILEYPITKRALQGLFMVEIPLTDLPSDTTEELFIRSTHEGDQIEQRLVLVGALEGHVTQAYAPNHRLILLEKSFNNGLRVIETAAPTVGQKIATVPEKTTAAFHLISILMDKVNLQRMRRLFKRGHRPFDQTTIIFESFGGRQVSDSPYAIYQLFTQLYPGFHFVWSIDNDRDLKRFCRDQHIPFVVRRTSKWVRTLQKAQFWISNARFPAWVRKPSYVTYIQTWHGTPLKKLGLDIENVSMPGTTTKKYHANFVKEANRWDALVSPNDYSTQIFRSAFGFNNQILKVGYPRNDELINSTPDDITALKQQLGLPLDKKVVLYAPTYRDNQFAEKGKYTFELPFSLDDFKTKFGEDTVLILRMHYLISNALDISDYSDFVYDFSSHPNISDLYLVSDTLITDYSSVFFDYAYLKRPIVFYPYDYHMYKDELRGFYLNYERDLPGQIAQDEGQLWQDVTAALKTPDMSENAKFMNFYNRFCAIDDGLSSLKIINYVVAQIQQNN
ncbi:CDP-glycerol glycerophosphotransferase family protein [Levilactobacillus bambusae]|uniref:CDP-glycerol glycerophosphotransferase family protein n=1 Tax=Levilactobacillus bambusae TaxID=2024736 RepID=A0A2V1MYL3_9LACO|nr:CDP-glycerol glycerophosphotransferase family protein [Levilactobacillus bambusae]PWF99901.1 CDP-glycerol glycerophosphotransferase family protein [Levilactobacillus bambusae]